MVYLEVHTVAAHLTTPTIAREHAPTELIVGIGVKP
jgi:hypothetical protein